MTDSPDDRRGVVTPEPDGGRRLVFRRSWPDPVDDVWSALSDNERSARWIGTYVGERGAGATGTFTMTHEAGSDGMPMTILECDPPRRLVLQWPEPLSWRSAAAGVGRLRRGARPGLRPGPLLMSQHGHGRGQRQPGDGQRRLHRVEPARA